MGDGTKFGTQSCPIELEAEEDEEKVTVELHKKKMSLLEPSLPMMDNSSRELVPYKSSSLHVLTASQNSANPEPVSPSIQDTGRLRNADSGNESPGFAEGSFSLDASTLASRSPGASRGFRRLAKAHKVDRSNVESSQKTELEREMELYEAAEREEEARLLTSLRHNQSVECSTSPKSPNSMESIQTDWKCGSSGPLGEQPKAKRGRRPGVNYQALRREEDVCFACFDGGQLILCDKRSCPKAYHMECTGRESEFFRRKGQWFCGWHVCASCSGSAIVHCYTCPNAYCSGCTKEAEFLHIRKGRGLCELCYRIVDMIEHNLSIDSEGVEVDFDDEETYECLFKAYWNDLKQKLLLTWSEIDKAYRAKDDGEPLSKGGDGEKSVDENGRVCTDSDCRPVTRRFKRKCGSKNTVIEDASCSEDEEEEQEEEEEEEDEEETLSKPKRGRPKGQEFVGWASKKLVDFLNFIKEDSKTQLTLISLNKLLLRYVEANKLNSGHRGQIRCDKRLQRLFGKKIVGKFQMMKLLTKHITSKRTANIKGGNNSSDSQGNLEVGKSEDKGQSQRRFKKKMDDAKQVQPDPSSYASIDVKNISLVYLKRSLLEEMRGDPDFESKVIGAFVRIRVPSQVNKSDTCYRLVQIVGLKKSANPRSNGRTFDVILEILNLHKREEITVDLISSQDFTAEECQRLRQSVKCGLLKALTVGEFQEKARILREAKVKDWFDTELLRLSHLRDRASEKGRRKELRECVERLQVLSSPSERERQLRAPIEITSDPHMDPDYVSENDGKSMKETRGNESLSETRFGGRRWESNSFPVKHHSHLDQKNYDKDQGWGSACSDKSAGFKVGRADDVDGKAISNCKVDGWGKELQNDEKDVGWTQSAGGVRKSNGWAEEGNAKQDDGWETNIGGHMNDEKCPGIKSADDGWGKQESTGIGCALREDSCDALGEDSRKRKSEECDKKDCGWGGNSENHKSDGWGGNEVDIHNNDGWGSSAGVNSNDNGNDDGGGGSAGGDGKDHGWGGRAGGESKDDGWGCRAGGESKDDGWGGNAGGNIASSHSKDGGWGGSTHSKDGGWGGDTHASNKDDGWGANAHAHSKDGGWGGKTGAESKDDGGACNARARSAVDGWGDNAGAHSKDVAWGNHAGNNEKNAGWRSGNENGGWGEAGGSRRESANANFMGRSSNWKSGSGGFNRRREFSGAETRPPYSDRSASLDRKEGFSGADTRPPYRDTEGFGRVSRQTKGAAPAASTKSGVDAIGMTTNNEKEKIWYYQDPSKTTQGPFSMEQLRKWERTKLFPLDLKIWRATDGQDASILLTDALLGRSCNDLPPGFGDRVQNLQCKGWGPPDDMKNAPGGSSSRWQDRGTRSKWDEDNTGNEGVPEKRHSSHGDSLAGARSWRSQGPDKPSFRDSGRDGSKGHWDREASRRDYSKHHHSHRPGNDGRFSTKKKDFPCRYFAIGMCKKGYECDFRH